MSDPKEQMSSVPPGGQQQSNPTAPQAQAAPESGSPASDPMAVLRAIIASARRPPTFTQANTRPVSSLLFDWSGWATAGTSIPPCTQDAITACAPAWAKEDITLDTSRIEGNMVQVLCRTGVKISPAFFSQRIKGRLQHALRKAGAPTDFSRKLAVRALGDNTRETVESYVRRQAAKSDYVDARYRAYLDSLRVNDPGVRLDEPAATARGRYWYNLHVVIVVSDRRYPVTRKDIFARLRETCISTAAGTGQGLARLAIMPDHIHMAMRGNLEQSPADIGLAFLNELSHAVGMTRFWSAEYYAGTFSEYAVSKIRPSH